MKPNPFLSGFVCGTALTLATVVAFVTYHKTASAPVPAPTANPLIPATGTLQLAAQVKKPVQTPSPDRGPANAPVTIVDFSDFFCPYCKKAAPTLLQVFNNYPNQVHIIYKNLPLSETPGQGSYLVHQAGVCAHEQGKFWPFHDAVYARADRPDAAVIRQIAAQIGLNSAAFESCLASGRPKKAIDADLKEARDLQVDGTPTFFINGQKSSGALSYQAFVNKIEAILNPGKQPPAAAPSAAAPVAPPEPPKIVEFNDLAGRPSEGPEKAPVLLVEFSDFHCPFCQRLEPTIQQVMTQYQGKVRKVWRHFPLQMHAGSDRTHQASECANQQGKFWPYHQKLFQNLNVTKDDALLISLAEQTGLKMKDFKKCLDSQEPKDIVQKDIQKGIESGVTGTPAVFVNGRIMKGAQPFASFQRVIDEELQKTAQPAKK